jgi:hypothetical protein
MCRTVVLALLLIASWPAVATANEAIKYETASAPVAPKRRVARILKRTVATGQLILLGIGY